MSMNSAPQPSSLPLRCADVVPYLSAYADGELAQPLRAQIAAHLETCDSCRAQLARYARIDATLMTLPRSAPSPEVFERIAAAVATHPSEPAVRESLNARRRVGARRVIELQQWGEDEAPVAPITARRSRLPRWAAAGLPTVAAILLVAFTAIALRGLGTQTPPTVTRPSPTVSGDPITATQSKIQSATAGKSIKFTAVSPTYVPSTLRTVTASVMTDPSGNGTLYLDVTWTLSSSVTQVHLREGPGGSAWYGYIPTNTSGLTWQVDPTNQWTPLTPSDGSGKLAVGEQREGMWLEMDATTAKDGGNSAQASALTTLRLMSLSMDQKYLPLPVQQIIPAPTNLMYHVKGNLVGSGGTVEGYYEPTQHESTLEVRTPGSHFIDIISDQQGIRLDPDTLTYQQMQPASLIPAKLDQLGQQLFHGADTDARTGGLLWYVGPATYNNADAYEFLLVTAPHMTRVYVNASSKQVEAVTVDLASSAQPGGANAPSWFTNDACIDYSLVEYVQQNPNISFSSEPPAGYHNGTVPAGIACAPKAGQSTSL